MKPGFVFSGGCQGIFGGRVNRSLLRVVWPLLFLAFFLMPDSRSQAGEDVIPAGDCVALSQQMTASNGRLAADLRQIKRELAALRQEMAEPGVKDVMAGVGYIFGLCGVAFFVAARNKAKDSGSGAA